MSDQTRIEDFCNDGDEFEDILYCAGCATQGGPVQDFLNDLWDKWDHYGLRAYLSQAQWDYLCRLASCD